MSLVSGASLLVRADAMIRMVRATQWLGPSASVLLHQQLSGQHQKTALKRYMKLL